MDAIAYACPNHEYFVLVKDTLCVLCLRLLSFVAYREALVKIVWTMSQNEWLLQWHLGPVSI